MGLQREKLMRKAPGASALQFLVLAGENSFGAAELLGDALGRRAAEGATCAHARFKIDFLADVFLDLVGNLKVVESPHESSLEMSFPIKIP